MTEARRQSCTQRLLLLSLAMIMPSFALARGEETVALGLGSSDVQVAVARVALSGRGAAWPLPHGLRAVTILSCQGSDASTPGMICQSCEALASATCLVGACESCAHGSFRSALVLGFHSTGTRDGRH